MKAQVFATPEAEQQILDVSGWWHAKRPSAEGQFDRELSDMLNLLQEAPDIGRRYRRARIPGLRRILLKKSRYHIYYVHDEEQQAVIVLAVWSAVRRRGPSLRKR